MRPRIAVALAATFAATVAIPLISVDAGAAGTGAVGAPVGSDPQSAASQPWFTQIGSSTPQLVVSSEDWGLLANGTVNNSGNYQQTFDNYFDTRAAQGYNAVEVSLFGFADLAGGSSPGGADWDGLYPFASTTDPTTAPNASYWARRDYFFASAASHGFRVFLNITTPYLSLHAFTASWTNAQWTALGTFLAGRYASQATIMWIVGDDYFGEHDAGLDALVAALRAGGANQPISIQNYQETS